ncbi:hypothetical protein HCN44_008401 [Aphidius gifuensis]|uniref:PDZ domain-containing protein n=1 Tax=Aphidius gifuensis TaxID=684658 RepID=A0A834XMW4_APHGI|nr:hypothetical protein HCN44_008401 [Aphidius gifuensis]
MGRSQDENDRTKMRWGPRRIVRIQRDSENNFGFSIISGMVDTSNANGSIKRGIFIKSVEQMSPAGMTGNLRIGDRIVEIDGFENQTHDQVVETIRKSKGVIELGVQSLVFSISRKSAGNVKRSQAEIEADPEQEDEFGYTMQKIRKKYKSLGKEVMLVTIKKNIQNVGISLAGHHDRTKMAVFICGLHPQGAAFECGQLKIGDEIIEANGHILKDRCHLNSSVVIKSLPGNNLKLVIRRRPTTDELAIPPVTIFPRTLDDSDQYTDFEGVRTIMAKKGHYGLGIMIVEGRHADVGKGIFISDVQIGSVAEEAGLEVGDMILGINSDTLLECTNDEATQILKRAEGMVKLVVCNPNKNKKEAASSDPKASSTTKEPGSKDDPKNNKEPAKPSEAKKPEAAVVKVVTGKPVTIELTRPKDSAIGMIVCGGANTPSGGVFVLDVYPGGIVEKDGKIKPGNLILEYGGENFKTVEYPRAQTLVLTMSGVIKINVLQDEPKTEQVDVELQRKPGKGVGISLTGFKNGNGAYITELLEGGSALESGLLSIGDQITSICKEDVKNSPIDNIITQMKISDPLQFQVTRYKVSK